MTAAVDTRDAGAVCEVLERAAETLLGAPNREGSTVRLGDRGTFTLTGDLHDNPIHLQKIRRVARLGDAPDRHLLLHELIHGDRLVNGLDLSYRVLCRVAELIAAFPGQVHPVLANHELSQMLGIGVSKGAGDSTRLFNDGLDFVFGDDADGVAAAIHAFFRAMPLAVRTANGLFCSHSLPSPEGMARFDAAVLGRRLVDADYRSPGGGAYLMTWGRGQNEAQVEALAKSLGVELFVVGHAYSETGAHVVTPRMVVLNSDHERGRVATVDLGAPCPSADDLVLTSLPLIALEGAEA